MSDSNLFKPSASGSSLGKKKMDDGQFANPPAYPDMSGFSGPGKIKDDAFFGNVETYRGELAVRLPLDAAQPGAKVTVKAESQGCADAGVCYPPQVQSLTVALPARGARPGEPVSAMPKKSWFN